MDKNIEKTLDNFNDVPQSEEESVKTKKLNLKVERLEKQFITEDGRLLLRG